MSLLFLIAVATATEFGLPLGPPTVGQTVPLEVVTSGTVPSLSPQRGQIEAPVSIGSGRFRFRYHAPSTPGPDTILLHDGDRQESLPIEVLPLPEAPPAPPVQDVLVGGPPIELLFPVQLQPGQWRIGVSEGRVLETVPGPDGLKVVVQPGEGRQARMLAVGVLDLRDPGQTPVMALVRLKARQQASITTEPGNSVTLKVAGRSWGPFVADSSGQAQVSFEIPPGTVGYEVVVVDDLGNTQRVRSALPGPFAPVILAMEAPRTEGGSDVWLGAWNATGLPWSGDLPNCRAGVSEPAPAILLHPGLYRFGLPAVEPNESRLDMRVECEVEESSVSLRVPVGREGPDHIQLQVYPQSLSTDFPLADVSAALVDARGERLPLEGLSLQAGKGSLVTRADAGNTLRGDYEGHAAVESGSDRLTAQYRMPNGAGRPWRLLLWVQPSGRLWVRVLDQHGRPLAGQDITVTGLEAPLHSDERGWAEATLPSPGVVEARSGAVVARAVPTTGEAPDPTAPDLSAWVDLPIHAGRVRQIFLEMSPRPLEVGQTARVRVRLVDTGGMVVRGETVTLKASEGDISPPVPAADGSLEAVYQPTPGQNARTVRIDANAGGASTSLDLELVPRPVRGSVSLTGGWIGNFGVVSSPLLSLSATGSLPRWVLPLEWRVGLATWQVAGNVNSASFDDIISISAQFVSVEAGAQWVRRVGRWQLSGGLSALLVPYSMTLSYGSAAGPSGAGLANPGLLVVTGAAWRVGISELPIELSYRFFNTSKGLVGFEGSPGGLGLTAGYRILY